MGNLVTLLTFNKAFNSGKSLVGRRVAKSEAKWPEHPQSSAMDKEND